MTNQIALVNKLNNSVKGRVQLSGISADQFHTIYSLYFQNGLFGKKKKNVHIFEDSSSAEKFHAQITKTNPRVKFFPSIENEIYSSILPSESNLFQRFILLEQILKNDSNIEFVIAIDALFLKAPPKSFFTQEDFSIETSQIISPIELSEKLVHLGYQKSLSIEEPGTFSNRGEIFDIYPLDANPIRIYYFDEMIEEIFEVNVETLKTIRNSPIEKISISKTPYSLLVEPYVSNLKSNFPRPSGQNFERLNYRKSIFKNLNSGRLFEDYPLFISLFFEEQARVLDYLDGHNLILYNSFNAYQNLENIKESLETDYLEYSQSDSYQIKPHIEHVYDFNIDLESHLDAVINDLDIAIDLTSSFENKIDMNLKSLDFIKSKNSHQEQVNALLDYLKIKADQGYSIHVLYSGINLLDEIKHMITTKIGQSALNKIIFHNITLRKGFEYDTEKSIYISDADFFQSKMDKTRKTKSRTEKDLFADQLSTLQVGDYVIHKNHGLGKYLGVQTLELNGSTSDFITLEYQDEDKVYVPVYRLNLLQKYSSSQTELKVANLKTKKFDLIKNKAKSSVKKLAFDLLELQAKRKLKKSHEFSPPSHDFNEFALSFKFVETEDQARAIEDVISDMQSQTPMDRLVCGDVGFGKTEIAMRASFLAVLDSKQVCILVPTTVLGLQHYNSFKERFKNFPVNIEFLSRFKSAAQSAEVINDLREGKIDILIGTHKLLSDKVKFKDLGLIVIDEEQRFGVGHKEKLKLLRESVDTLTLTATPIPRTLQLSFLGIKELSLIKTPPPKRQSIKTYIIKDDKATLKSAIEKELNRGGQIFIVRNKVTDIELYTGKIRELTPNARIIYAHGQLSAKELEKRISDFYKHKYDILVATTIIESGIDIPNANTMIIDRADTYGLSQLHQLRGRIGRSDKKAYAYFIIPSDRNLSEVANKRLKAIQTYAEIGSGFSLATSDLEIRGSGDILGAEQSGHLANIGLELYMDLLQEAIKEIKGESVGSFKDIEIINSFNAYIPESYIEDSATRIKYYKTLSNKKDLPELEDCIEEITDQYGQLPIELKSLVVLLKSRMILQGFGITKIKVQTQSIILSFDQPFINENPALQTAIINFFMQRPKVYKINPDFSINCKFKDKIEVDTLFDFAKYIAEQIKIC